MKRTFCNTFGILMIGAILWSEPATAQNTAEVEAVGLTFDPPDVEIRVGDSVHWTGLLVGFHSVAEVDDAAAMVWNDGFHSASLASEFTQVFDTVGTFYYICEPHVLSDMRGTVTVLPTVPAVSTWGLGAATLFALATGSFSLLRRRRTQPVGA